MLQISSNSYYFYEVHQVLFTTYMKYMGNPMFPTSISKSVRKLLKSKLCSTSMFMCLEIGHPTWMSEKKNHLASSKNPFQLLTRLDRRFRRRGGVRGRYRKLSEELLLAKNCDITAWKIFFMEYIYDFTSSLVWVTARPSIFSQKWPDILIIKWLLTHQATTVK